MKSSIPFAKRDLDDAKRNNLHRRLFYGRVCGSRIVIGSKSLLNLCSNDYLGMPALTTQTRQMESSSRLVSGNDYSYEILEKKLARHKYKQKSLIYPTGYMANLGVISAMVKKGDLILSDELNHASIIQACRLTGARTLVYRHNDMDDLADKIRQKSRNKFVITEGIFSMDGDYAKLPQIVEFAQKYGAMTIVDDAHGDFAVGADGKGTPNQLRVSKKIDVYISSLSKALGSFGGYVAAGNTVIDLCINRSKPFIYTSALPSMLVDYSLSRFDSDREKYRKKLLQNIEYFSAHMHQIGYELESDTHIVPIIVGDEKTALDMGRFLRRNGIFAQPIRYPTVPRNKARIRISITAWLSKNEIRDAVAVFEMAAKKFKMKLSK